MTLLDPDLFRHPNFTAGVSGQMLQQITLGGAMIALPLFFQMTLEYNALEAGLSLAPLSLTMFAAAMVAGRRAGDRRPAAIIRAGFLLASLGIAVIIPFVPRVDSGWYFVAPARRSRAAGWACWCRSSTTTRSRPSRRSGSARPPA